MNRIIFLLENRRAFNAAKIKEKKIIDDDEVIDRQ